MINKIWVNLREAETYGIDTTGYKDRLEQARSRRTFAEASSIVEDVRENLKSKLSSFHDIQHDRASNMYHYVRSEILGASKLGMDVTDYQSMLDRASSSISRSNYSEAITTMESCLEKLKAAAGGGSTQGTAGATVGGGAKKPEPVWEPDDDDEQGLPDGTEGTREFTDAERLKILEDRFILGEVSEESYRELKSKLVARMSAKHIK